MKKVLVTGGNKGIGLAVCRQLLAAHPDVYVLLGSRDKSRGALAVKQLAPHQDRVEVLEVR